MTQRAMMEIRTLGGLSLSVAGYPRRLTVDKQMALLIYLACHEGQAFRRVHLAELLWEEAGSSRARGSLSQALYEIRKRLPELTIEADRNTIMLPTNSVRVDALLFRLRVESNQPEEAIDLYAGDFLDGFWIENARRFEEWQSAERSLLNRLALQALNSLLKEAQAEGGWYRVIQYADRILRLSPHNEMAIRARIEAIAANEGLQQAMNEYSRAVELLVAEHGEPDMETRILGARLMGTPADVSYFPEEAEQHLTSFVGRRSELRWLSEEWHKVKAGMGRAVIVTGEPGIGKSRLCEQFLRICAVQGGRIFQSDCHVADQHIPYSAIVHCLLSSIRKSDVESLQPEWASILSGVMPELREHRPDLDTIKLMDGEGDKRRIFEAFARFFEMASSDSPVVICVDDFQWCDYTTVSLAHYLTRRLASRPVLILLSMRLEGEAMHVPQSMVVTDATASPGYQRLSLDPMTHEDVKGIFDGFKRNILSLTDSTRDEIYKQIGGRPFFIIEILRAMSQGEIAWEPEMGKQHVGTAPPLPPTVEEFLYQLISGLGVEARTVLTTLATLGTGADPNLISEIANIVTEDLLVGVEDLVDRGLIRETDSGIEFAHDLIRETAYRSLGKSRRRALHAAAGEQLSVRGLAQPGKLAGHYDMAGMNEQAYSHALVAAEESAKVGALQEAEHFLEIARSNAKDTASKAAVSERLAKLLHAQGRYSETVKLYRRLVRKEVIIKDPVRMLAVNIGILKIEFKQGSIQTADLRDRVSAFIDIAESHDEYDHLIELLKLRVHIGHNTGDPDLVLQSIDRLYTLLDQTENLGAQIVALSLIANVAGLYRGVSQALVYSDEAVARASMTDKEVPLIMALTSRGLNRLSAGLLTSAESDIRYALELVDQIVHVTSRQFSHNILSLILLEQGRYDEARVVLEEAIQTAVAADATQDLVINKANLLLVEYELGDHLAASQLARDVISLSERAPFVWSTRGAWSVLGLYALDEGDLDAAVGYRRAILDHSAGRNSWVTDASYSEIFFARLTTAQGDTAGALERLEEAIDAYSDRDFFCRCRLQLERARLLLEDDPEEAGRQAAEVRSGCREVGARPLVMKADALLDLLPELRLDL